MRDPELVARAQRAAARLESAWEQWRSLHGLAVTPSQPVVSYVGYSLKEPWGEPRVVIGIDADEAEFLAEFLDRDQCASTGPLAGQQQLSDRQPSLPQQQLSAQQVIPHQGMSPQVMLSEQQSPEGGPLSSAGNPLSPAGDYTSTALLGAPVPLGIARQAADPNREIAAELAGWSSGELPGQASEQLAGWPEQSPGAA
jgi:hypothetical protein